MEKATWTATGTPLILPPSLRGSCSTLTLRPASPARIVPGRSRKTFCTPPTVSGTCSAPTPEPSPAAISASLNTYGIVSLKHFTALAILRACYPVIATPDAELSTRGRVGAALAGRAARLGTVLAGFNPLSRCNLRRAAEYAPREDVEELRSLTRDFTLDSWWSDVPVYRAAARFAK